MAEKRVVVLAGAVVVVAIAAAVGWIAGSRIESPADAAARTAPPKPSPILVPIEKRVLSTELVTRGTARFGLPQPVSIAPSTLKAGPSLISTLPVRNTQLEEGAVLLTASGRPVFILQGKLPAYRDLVPGSAGKDIRQLEEALTRLGFDPGPTDGTYDQRTSTAVARWYESRGWEPFGPTRAHTAAMRSVEQEWEDARKTELAATAALSAAGLEVEAARASAEAGNSAAAAELAARRAERRALATASTKDRALSIEAAKAQAKAALEVAKADVAAKIAERARTVLDPRQPKTAREAVEANLKLAQAALEQARVEGELAIRRAQRESGAGTLGVDSADAAIKSAKAAVNAAALAGKRAIRAALDARKIAAFEAKLAVRRVSRLSAKLEQARSKLGIQVPVDELVFLPTLPVRVEAIQAAVGDAATGTLLSVTDNRLSIDASLPLETAPLVRPGMQVRIDEQALGVTATGLVKFVADRPGTRGVDGFHFYFEVAVEESSMKLEGFSLRLTIPIESTAGEVIAVPASALSPSLSADGTSRIRVERGDALEYVAVKPGLSADGFVAVSPVAGVLNPGELVVVGVEHPSDGLPP